MLQNLYKIERIRMNIANYSNQESAVKVAKVCKGFNFNSQNFKIKIKVSISFLIFQEDFDS